MKSIKTWLIDFHAALEDGKPGEHIETVEIERVNAPTRWAERHVFTLRRKLRGKNVVFSITAC